MTKPASLWALLLIRLLRNPKLSTFTFPHEAIYTLGYSYKPKLFSAPTPHSVHVWKAQICTACGSVCTAHGTFPVRSIHLSVPTCTSCNSPVSTVAANACTQLNFALSQLTPAECALVETALSIH